MDKQPHQVTTSLMCVAGTAKSEGCKPARQCMDGHAFVSPHQNAVDAVAKSSEVPSQSWGCDCCGWMIAEWLKVDRLTTFHLQDSLLNAAGMWPRPPMQELFWREGLHFMHGGTSWIFHSACRPLLRYIFLSGTSASWLRLEDIPQSRLPSRVKHPYHVLDRCIYMSLTLLLALMR